MADADEFWVLRNISLTDLSAEDWDAYYARMQPWLLHAEASVRQAAVERLTMAVLRAEARLTVPYRHTPEDAQRALDRMHWLLRTVQEAHAQHPDLLPALLHDLRYHGDDAPFNEPLVDWLLQLERSPLQGVDPNQALGVRLLIQTFVDWPAKASELMGYLDHASDYTRACAAHRLGDTLPDDDDRPSDDELIAHVVSLELKRPGVLGPFYSPRYDFDNRHADALWLLDILERRAGNAPADLPFNDIDFYLHELCAMAPDLVRRMMAGGRHELAAMTATEMHERVPGMESVLQELLASPNAQVANVAKAHLARHYNV
ncbi:MAG: hypothetical protein HC858_08160 [Brachymonas sp.]|nr:hypothetical protein [Brachymonas sp.]